MKTRLYPVVSAKPHTMNIDIDGLHNIVAADCTTLAHLVREKRQKAGDQTCDK